MSRSTHFDGAGGNAGFTLIEVLVALAVVAVSLAAIGALMATSVRATRSIDQHFALAETTRGIITGLPDRSDLGVGSRSGEAAGYRWRLDVAPFVANFVNPRAPTPWVPQSVVVRVQSPAGPVLQINTVRLRRRAGG